MSIAFCFSRRGHPSLFSPTRSPGALARRAVRRRRQSAAARAARPTADWPAYSLTDSIDGLLYDGRRNKFHKQQHWAAAAVMALHSNAHPVLTHTGGCL